MSDALSQLRDLSFFPDIPEGLSDVFLDWLLLEDSMTKRFEQYCAQITVEIVNEGFVTPDVWLPEAKLLPDVARYWLREIVLLGDGVPWLCGRTVVPETTLDGPEKMLQHLGTTPLGRYLFSASPLTRDFIQIGRSAQLWGRRSRLRLDDKPLMLTELFLPASPLYHEEKTWRGA